jgi:hypothetical protein
MRLIASTYDGIWVIEDGLARKVIPNYHFGLCRWDGGWLAFANKRLVFFDDSFEKRVFLSGLPGGCHQIDRVNHMLFVCATYDGKLLRYDLGRGEWMEPWVVGDRDTHVNGVLGHEGMVWTVHHNQTARTGKETEIVGYSEAGERLQSLQPGSRGGHNVLFWRGVMYHCDSMGSRVRCLEAWGEWRTFADLGETWYPRGLAVCGDYLVVGCSRVEPRRQCRSRSPGAVKVLDGSGGLVEHIDLEESVRDLRSYPR